MDIFNFTHNRLLLHGFQSVELEGLQDLGLSCYRSDFHHVILKDVHTQIQLDEIKSVTTLIRSIMLNSSINVWNTYLLLCFENNFEHEMIFQIERDSRAIRKYVIIYENDLNRIPFLDETTRDPNPFLKDWVFEDENTIIKKIFNLVRETGSRKSKFTMQQVELLSNQIIEMVDTTHEN